MQYLYLRRKTLAARLLRDSWVSALKQILFNIYIKDPGTRKERPPTLLVCVITVEDTRKNWTPEGTGSS